MSPRWKIAIGVLFAVALVRACSSKPDHRNEVVAPTPEHSTPAPKVAAAQSSAATIAPPKLKWAEAMACKSSQFRGHEHPGALVVVPHAPTQPDLHEVAKYLHATRPETVFYFFDAADGLPMPNVLRSTCKEVRDAIDDKWDDAHGFGAVQESLVDVGPPLRVKWIFDGSWTSHHLDSVDL